MNDTLIAVAVIALLEAIIIYVLLWILFNEGR